MNDHNETLKIKELMKTYLTGTFDGNVEKLESVFHEKAVMNGYLGDDLVMGTPAVFIEDIALSPSMRSENCEYHGEIESILIEKDIAQVVLSETGFRGNTSLVNCFHLIKTNGKWKIISKLFTTI